MTVGCLAFVQQRIIKREARALSLMPLHATSTHALAEPWARRRSISAERAYPLGSSQGNDKNNNDKANSILLC